MSEDRLVLICEGGAHTVEYFHKNGVYPGAIVMTATKFREMMPYLTEKDDILVVIKGLTDFSVAEIYALFNDLETVQDKLKNITIMSNVDLGLISTPYYFYTGDLFYGKVQEVINNKYTDVVDEGEEEAKKEKKKSKGSKRGKNKGLEEKTIETIPINPVLRGYKKYNKRGIKFTIYGSETREREVDHETDNIVNKLLPVDLYQNKNE